MVFQMTPTWALSTLATVHRPNGETLRNLIPGMDGRFYGIIPARFSMDGPMTGGAIFRLVQPPVVQVAKLSGGDVNLTWNSISGNTYGVEYKPALSAVHWTVLDPAVAARSSTTSFTDNSVSATERYYRVRLLP